LRFEARRDASHSEFHRDLDFRSGTILVAVCTPIHPRTPFFRRPDADRWQLWLD
jgi:hypothetical protein